MVGLLLFYVAVESICIGCHSPAIDETAHLPAGLSHFETGRIELYAVNPPLVRLLASLPVYAIGPNHDWSRHNSDISARAEFPVSKDFFRANGPTTLRYYVIARLALLPYHALGIIAVFLVGRRAFTSWFGVIAAGMWVLSPAMLGNGAMITPDSGASVAGVVFVYLLLTKSWVSLWRDVLLCSVASGYVVCTKFTWIVVLPFIVLLHSLLICGGRFFSYSVLFRLATGALLASLTINLVYGFDRSFTRLGDIHFSSSGLNTTNPDADLGRTNRFHGTWMARIPCPLPQTFIEGIDVQRSDFERGYRSYLMGQWKHGGWWYYYLVGFLVKEPIGFQLMLYVSILHGFWGWKRWTRDGIREWALILVPPVLIFTLVSSQTGFNHHMRYVLPAYPFLFIIAARTVTLGRFWKWFSYACMTWQAASVLWFAPHWMSYFNEAAGGPLNGHKWLVDSNIDWGQDILGLKKWQDKHPEVTDLQAALFTGFDPKDIGLKFRLPAPYIAGEPQTLSKDKLRGPQPGWYAVSVCQLKGHSFSVPAGDGTWEWSEGHFTYFMDHFEPVDRIGYSIYIYHISEAQAAAVRQRLLEDELRNMSRKGQGEV